MNIVLLPVATMIKVSSSCAHDVELQVRWAWLSSAASFQYLFTLFHGAVRNRGVKLKCVLMHAATLSQQLDYITSEVNESLESVREALLDLFAALKELVETPVVVPTTAPTNDAVSSDHPGAPVATANVADSPMVTVTGCRNASAKLCVL